MDGMLQPAATTTFDAVASMISLLAYLAVAAAALARAPRDTRAHVFFAIALTTAVVYAVAPLSWWKGAGAVTPMAIAVTATAFCIGSVALFHFSQIFPARRPWIRAHRTWLLAAYIVPPLPLAAVAWFVGQLAGQFAAIDATGSGGLGAVSAGSAEVGIEMLLALPLMFVVGLVLPFSGIMSFFKSWQEAKKAGDEPARASLFWMLVSQLGGGVLAVLVLPLLHVIGVSARWGMVIGALAYAFAMLMPIAFALAVWRYRMLSTSI